MPVTETEAAFETWVDDTRRVGGWLATHFRPGRTAKGWRTQVTGDTGYPDWTLVHPDGRLIIAELKSDGGRVALEQTVWLDVLANAARGAGTLHWFGVCLWRPADRPEILDVLLRGVSPTATRWVGTNHMEAPR